MLSAKLVVVGGEVKTTEIKLRLPAIIGRGKGSTITLLQPLVSRQHCELFEANGKLWVRDLGSLNGTYVNNEKISEAVIPPNELLTVGTVTFRAIYEPLADNSAPSERVPEFLPSKAKQDDDQPTIRVDAPGAPVVEDISSIEEVDVTSFEDEGVPDTPLFESDETRPAKPAPARPAPAPAARPSIPAMAPQAAAPATPVPAAPTAAEPEPEAEGGDDDDLNDFLKSLGKK